MKEKELSRSHRLFRLLVRALPMDFQANYGGQMEGVFHEQEREVRKTGGVLDFLKLWTETLTGIFTTAPREHWEILKNDCSYALRMMRKNAGFTTVAVLTLALGIGANSAIFSVVHSVLLRPLPYPDGQELVFVRQQAQKAGIQDIRFSVHEIQDYREQNKTLAGLVEYHGMEFILYGHGDPDRIRTGVVSANYFDLFGIKPILGRTFVADDDRIGAPPVLVLSYEYWKGSFGADPAIVGKTFELNDKVHTVVGVLPPVPQYPNENDVYMPTSACPFRSSERMIGNRDARMMEVFGRVKQGVSVEAANADLSTIAGRLKSEYPKSYPDKLGYVSDTTSLQSELTKGARPTLLVLLAAAAFVLLIACANVANLTLARMSRRERELAVRTALGAGRSRLLRQLLTESFILALLGGALGLLVAYGSLTLLSDFAARLTPRAREIRIDGGVLMFTLFAALGTSIVFGTIAALFSRANLTSSLKEGSSGVGAGQTKNRVRSVLIVSQVAFSFVLLIGAGLMLRSLIKMLRVDPGFVPQRVLAMGTSFSFSKYSTNDQYVDIGKKVLSRVQAVPGVLSAAISDSYPMQPDIVSGGANAALGAFQIQGREIGPAEAPPVSSVSVISPDYFRTLGIPIKAGRAFTDADDSKSLPVVLSNETARHQYWPNEDPIGKFVSYDNGKTWLTIVGVVGDVREFGPQHPAIPEFFVPQAQNPAPLNLTVRTIADPRSMSQAIARAVHDVDSQAAVAHVLTLEQARSDSMASPRVTASLLAIFAGLALLIAAAGIGGIMALTVSQRTREIGIRMALGARPWNVMRMVLGQGMLLAALGVGIGIVGAFALARLLKTLLFEVAPNDPFTFVSVAATLVVAAAVAGFLPARRAASIDPMVALRSE